MRQGGTPAREQDWDAGRRFRPTSAKGTAGASRDFMLCVVFCPERIRGAISSAISGLCCPSSALSRSVPSLVWHLGLVPRSATLVWYPGPVRWPSLAFARGLPPLRHPLLARAAAADVNPRTRLSHMILIPALLGA
jgi:hypothetical protein